MITNFIVAFVIVSVLLTLSVIYTEVRDARFKKKRREAKKAYFRQYLRDFKIFKEVEELRRDFNQSA